MKFQSFTLTAKIGISQALCPQNVAMDLVKLVDHVGDKLLSYVSESGADVTRDGLTLEAKFDTLQSTESIIGLAKSILERWDMPGVHIFDINVTLNLALDEVLLREIYDYAMQFPSRLKQLPPSHPTATYTLSPHERWEEYDDDNLIPTIVTAGPLYSWDDKNYEIDSEPLSNWRAHLPDDGCKFVNLCVVMPANSTLAAVEK